MFIRKSSVVMMLLFSFLITSSLSCGTDPKDNEARVAYRNTMDHVAAVFSDMLYPFKKGWQAIVDALSPHHPVIKDVKNAADYIGQKVPVIAQEIVQDMQTKAHEINDYVMQEAEQTAHRVTEHASQVITDASTRALDHTQKTIETSVHNATQDAVVQVKDAHQELLKETDTAVQATVDRAMQTVQNAATEVGRTLGHELGKELKDAAEQISDDVAQKIESHTRKNSVVIAKIVLLSSVGLSGLATTLMGSYRYMHHGNNPQDLGFVGGGLLFAVLCYNALDAIS